MPDRPPDAIPLFPLDNVVLFPTISVPLFVFEPRYRAMTKDALAGDRRIGMVAVRPEARPGMEGDPALFDVGCEGAITHAQERPDGTWNLLLAATRRFRILEEPPRGPDRPYRVARVEGLPEPDDAAAVGACRRSIEAHLAEILRRTAGPDREAPSLERVAELDDARFVNVLAQALDFAVLEKQRLIEAAGTGERARILDDLLRFRLAEIEAHSGAGSDRLQ